MSWADRALIAALARPRTDFSYPSRFADVPMRSPNVSSAASAAAVDAAADSTHTN